MSLRFYKHQLFYGIDVVTPTPNPPTRSTRVSLFTWAITFDLSDRETPTNSYATISVPLRVIRPHKLHYDVKIWKMSGVGVEVF